MAGGFDAAAHDGVLVPAVVGAHVAGEVARRRGFICLPLEQDSCSGQALLRGDWRLSHAVTLCLDEARVLKYPFRWRTRSKASEVPPAMPSGSR